MQSYGGRGFLADLAETARVAAHLGVYLVVSAAFVATAVILIGWSLTAERPAQPPPTEPATVRRLRADNESLRAELEKRNRDNTLLEADLATQKLNLDALRRGAILFPERRGDARPQDLIPAQDLPIPTMPAPFPSPGEFGVNP